MRSIVLVCLTLGCAASAPPPKMETGAKEPGPRCPPGSEEMPKDARDKMASLQGAVRKCYQLGTGAGESDVKVEVSVRESGEVRDVTVLGAAPHPSSVECLKKTLRKAKFAKFCGADVSISWTYALR